VNRQENGQPPEQGTASPQAHHPSRYRRLGGGLWGVGLVVVFFLVAAALFWGLELYPQLSRSYGQALPFHRAMFGPALTQPIPFSHRLHVTDKSIDCFFCHPYGKRSINAGLPSVDKCLGCHKYIIPEHEEILKLKAYKDRQQPLPWIRVYYNPDHVYFPHMRHLAKNVRCAECHGEVERVDRLNQVTFYMGFCLNCHNRRGATRECVACHQ
jgi:hypothetical protein